MAAEHDGKCSIAVDVVRLVRMAEPHWISWGIDISSTGQE